MARRAAAALFTSRFPGGDPVLVAVAEQGTREDVASWLKIVREVEHLFGPMPDFEATLLRNISRGTALRVRDNSGQVNSLCGCAR